MVTSRNTTVRPGTSSGLSGRTSLTTRATIDGSAKPHAIHIAASRANIASVLNFSGKVLLDASKNSAASLQIEFGINPEQQSDDERQRQRDEKSGSVHGAGFSRGGRG